MCVVGMGEFIKLIHVLGIFPGVGLGQGDGWLFKWSLNGLANNSWDDDLMMKKKKNKTKTKSDPKQ